MVFYKHSLPQKFSKMNSSIRNDVKEIIARVKELDTRPDKEERALKQELFAFFWLNSFFGVTKSAEEKRAEVVRAKEIIELLGMDVNRKVLCGDTTLLYASVDHSLEMVEMLLQKGADVNLESSMPLQTALDAILDDEGDRTLSEEKKAMKSLLLSKNAKTKEERARQMSRNN